MTCCDYDDFYRDEGLMTPIHDCPAPPPLQPDDLDRPLTDLEHELLGSIFERMGRNEGKIVDLRRDWT